MPVAATMPNITSPAPPSTKVGSASTSAPIFGMRPSTIRMMPPATQTKRLRTPVTPTRPTFCENDGVGEGVEDAADHGAEAVGAQACGQHRLGHLLAGHVAQRQEHAGRFDHDDDHHQRHGDDQHRIEDRHAEAERRDQGEPAGFGDLVEMHHAERGGDDAADDDAEQDRDVGDEALAEAGDGEDRDQHDRRDDDVADRRVGGWPSARAPACRAAPARSSPLAASSVTAFSHSACSGATSLGAVGPTGLPKIQLMPMRISETPMTRMIVPVTTGGKKRSMRLTRAR
jgi:hypothetical protein